MDYLVNVHIQEIRHQKEREGYRERENKVVMQRQLMCYVWWKY